MSLFWPNFILLKRNRRQNSRSNTTAPPHIPPDLSAVKSPVKFLFFHLHRFPYFQKQLRKEKWIQFCDFLKFFSLIWFLNCDFDDDCFSFSKIIIKRKKKCSCIFFDFQKFWFRVFWLRFYRCFLGLFRIKLLAVKISKVSYNSENFYSKNFTSSIIFVSRVLILKLVFVFVKN